MDGHRLTLLIDAGNTRVKAGWVTEDGLREPGALALAHSSLSHFSYWLERLPGEVKAALGVSVAAGTLNAQIEDILFRRANVKMQWLTSSPAAGGVLNLYDQPESLGRDRWVALIGLARRTPEPALLASFGTATTVDLLGPATDSEPSGWRRFEGGLILPGPELMRMSLAKGTAGLPYAQGKCAPFPRNTHTAISSGVAAAQAGAVMRQWHHARDMLGRPPLLYCSGGGWPDVAEEMEVALAGACERAGLPAAQPLWVETPVLDGLAALAGD